jgi:hypothetical protein
MIRRLFGAIGLMVVMVVAAPAADASAKGSQALTIESPQANQVVSSDGQTDVLVRSRVGLGAMRISVNGQDITSYFHGSAGVYSATLGPGHGLYPGVDELSVEAKGYADFDDVAFIVARPVPGLVSITNVRTREDGAPVGATVQTATDSTLRVWVNGHRDEGAFEPQGGAYVGRLGANDWLRPGPNQLVALAYQTSASGRSAVYTVETTTFWLERGVLTASAGRNLVVNADDFVVLHGDASDLGTRVLGARAVSYRWRIVGHPHASKGTLEDADSATPGFEATAPGEYLVQLTAKRANSAASVDTVTVDVRADVPPIGWRLDSAADDLGTVKLNGQAVPGTTCSDPQCPLGTFATWAVFNRQTLQRVDSGVLLAQRADWLTTLIKLVAKYKRTGIIGDPTYLMVLNIAGAAGLPPELRQLLESLGAGNLIAPPTPTSSRSISVVGVPGSPPGSASISASYQNNYAPGCLCVGLADMPGYLRLNTGAPSGGDFEFVRTDQSQFNTDASTAPLQIAIQVGGRTYTHSVPTDGSSGFFAVVVNSQTLDFADRQDFFVTNNPDRSENPNEEVRLADMLSSAAVRNNAEGDQLVLLQSFGRPRGLDGAWLRAGLSIERLGGNGQVFTQLNQGNAAEPYQGAYAFVGRSAMGAPAAESSQSLTNLPNDGRLQGLLSRGLDNQYLPLLADPAGTINFDLVNLVNRPTAPNNRGFPYWTPRQEAAVDFLARDPDVMGLCPREPSPCDVRKDFYEKYNADWATILTNLGNDIGKAACAKPGSDIYGHFFDPPDCNEARLELQLEISRRNRVEAYFNNLAVPFGTAQVGALADIAKIATEINGDVKPPAANNTVSHALNVVAFLLKIAGAAAGVANPTAGTVVNGLAAAVGLAAYLTNEDGSPDLIGPVVTAEAAQLGINLVNRYQHTLAYFSAEAKIIMSDGTKLADFVASANSNPKWQLGDVDATSERIRLATRQTMYQAMVPVAYPILYDLGTGLTKATDWYCYSAPPLVDKNLFQNTGDGAQVLYKMNDPALQTDYRGARVSYFGQVHLMVVGARHAVGATKGAYIPAPPKTLTDKLFSDFGSGGAALYKLAFYSPQNFRVFSPVLQQDFGFAPGKNSGFRFCQSMPDPPGNSSSGSGI